MIDTYKISKAYPGNHSAKYNEIEILSDNLLYAEIGDSHSGCQCMNIDNQEEIHKKCRQISQLIKEVDALNKPNK